MSENFIISKTESYIIFSVVLDQIDVFNIKPLSDEIIKSIEKNKATFLDLKNVIFMDSSGLGGLIKIKKRLNEKSSELYIINMQPRVESVMELTKTSQFLNCFPTLEEALKKMTI